jgi:hypothetical protein
MSEEIPLGGGAMTDGVVRIGDTLRRPSRFAPQLMRDVLVHLAQGFRAPEFDSLPTLRPLPWTRGSTTTSPTRRGPDADLAGRARPPALLRHVLDSIPIYQEPRAASAAYRARP